MYFANDDGEQFSTLFIQIIVETLKFELLIQAGFCCVLFLVVLKEIVSYFAY